MLQFNQFWHTRNCRNENAPDNTLLKMLIKKKWSFIKRSFFKKLQTKMLQLNESEGYAE